MCTLSNATSPSLLYGGYNWKNDLMDLCDQALQYVLLEEHFELLQLMVDRSYILRMRTKMITPINVRVNVHINVHVHVHIIRSHKRPHERSNKRSRERSSAHSIVPRAP